MQPNQIRVFDGLRITTEHIDHLQGALHSALRDLREIAGTGVHRGFDVTLGTDGVATVAPGMAIDGAGNRLISDDPLQVPIGLLNDNEPRFLCLRYDRVENGEVEGRPTLAWDSCVPELRPAPPEPRDNLVTLARIVGNPGGGLRIEPPVDEVTPAEVAPEAVPPLGGLGMVQGVLRLDGAEAEMLPRLTDAIRAVLVRGDPLVVPLLRRDVALEGGVLSMSCQSVLSAAFAGPDGGEVTAPGLRCHASASAETTFGADGVAQWALSTIFDSDRGLSRPSLGDGWIANLDLGPITADAAEGSLPAALSPLELRVRAEGLEGGNGFALAAELLWSGETGEAAATVLSAMLGETHWEFSVAWKVLAVSSQATSLPGE